MPTDVNTEAKPPAGIKNFYKTFQKLDKNALDMRSDIIDFHSNNDANESRIKKCILNQLPDELQLLSEDSISRGGLQDDNFTPHPTPTSFYEVKSIPGFFIYPSLLPTKTQLELLNKLLHHNLCNADHKTNIHLHYHIPYPKPNSYKTTPSFFSSTSSNLIFHPKDPSAHKPLTTQQFLSKKLRWMTLGGQYDWTNKTYPSDKPPGFPSDIKTLIESYFPCMKAEAAIINLYSPGDTLSLHRDVSEESDKPLVSISLGCEGIFVIGLDDVDENGRARTEVIRLRSGDAVLMGGRSRFAWHGVPKVVEGSCPEWMVDWPFVEEDDEGGNREFAGWRGWMRGKRINVNVRQMFDE